MHFSAEHDALRETVRDFVAKELRPHADEWEAAEGFPDSVFTRMGELGLLGLRYPEQYGGQGGDYFSAIVLAEEMARCGSGGVGMAISVHTEMATPPILRWGTEEQKQRYLVPAIRGEKIAALGITEPDAGSDVANIRTRADRVDGHWRINGSKLYITNGVRCDFILLVARTGSQEDGSHGITLFLVDKNLPGFSVSRKLKKLGMHSSDTAELSFNDVEVGDDAVLGEVGQGFYNLMWELQGERLIGSAGSIAGAEVAFEETLKWCKEREAFGRPIGKFQVNRHKLVDLYTEITVAKNFVYSIAERWDRDEYPVTEISMAKLAGRPGHHAGRRHVPATPRWHGLHGRNWHLPILPRLAAHPHRRRHRRGDEGDHRQDGAGACDSARSWRGISAAGRCGAEAPEGPFTPRTCRRSRSLRTDVMRAPGRSPRDERLTARRETSLLGISPWNLRVLPR